MTVIPQLLPRSTHAPLFASAAAVVRETGGILSHCAVGAREFRIPAVLGITGATQRFEDGMLLKVDGDAGIVQIGKEL